MAGKEGVRLYELAQSASGGPGGNPTVSDFFYLALALGKIEVEVCDDVSFDAGAVVASTGKRIETALCIKNFGYRGGAPAEHLQRLTGQVIPTPLHVLGHISPIFFPSFLVFCAFSPSRRDGSNEPQAATQGHETVARGSEHRLG